MSDRDDLSAVVGTALIDHQTRWALRQLAFERGEPNWKAEHPSTEIPPLHVADAILKSDWLAARDARVKAEALRDAARQCHNGATESKMQRFYDEGVAQWLEQQAVAAEYPTMTDAESLISADDKQIRGSSD